MAIFGGSDTRINATFTATDKATPVVKTLRSNIAAVGSKAGGPLGGLLGGLSNLSPATLIAGVGIGAMTAIVGDSIAAFEESERITAQTEAALKSTGNAAGLTADQIGDLANTIANYSGIDDEAIQKGENLLLTFTNIKDAAGEGNDIFTQTTKIMVDMGVAMGTDAAGAAIQLGKALNDPVKGLTALTRVGVTFSKQQTDQIAVMQKAGDIAGAQRVILAELNKEFGGSAEAFGQTATGSIGKFNVALGNLEESIGQKLTPALEKAADALVFLIGKADDVNPIVERNNKVMAMMEEQSAKTGKAVGSLGKSVTDMSGEVDAAAPVVVQAIGQMGSDGRRALRERYRQMEADTLQLGGDLAANLRASKGVVHDAMGDLIYAIHHPLQLEKDRALIAGKLMGQKLHDGLLSKNPMIRAVAEQTKEKLMAEWELITGEAWTQGETAGSTYANGYKSGFAGGLGGGGSWGQPKLSQTGRDAYRKRYQDRNGAPLSSGPSGGSGDQHVHIHIDGKEVADVVNRRWGMGWNTAGSSSTRN